MSKQTICICGNKDADQLHGDREADQCLCFCHRDSTTISLLSKSNISKLLVFFCDDTDQFVSDLFKNHIVGLFMMWLI